MALGAMASAAIFGTIWARAGQSVAVLSFAVGLGVAVTIAAVLLMRAGPPAGIDAEIPAYAP
jgi:hypothetical protein